MQRSAYSSVLVWLLIIAAIQLSLVGYVYWQILSITVISFISGMIAVLSISRGVIFFLSAENDRRQNGLLFSNSILNSQSDESIINYQKFNIRILETHKSGPNLLYISVTVMAICLFFIQSLLAPYIDYNLDEIKLLFGQISTLFPNTITFLGVIILGSGIIGLIFNIFSKFMIAKWTGMPKEEILTEAQNLQKYQKYSKSEMTYEDAIALLADAEFGDPTAIEEVIATSVQIDRQIDQFKRTRRGFVLIIIIISIIDAIIFLFFI